jgi:hypothetical protein
MQQPRKTTRQSIASQLEGSSVISVPLLPHHPEPKTAAMADRRALLPPRPRPHLPRLAPPPHRRAPPPVHSRRNTTTLPPARPHPLPRLRRGDAALPPSTRIEISPPRHLDVRARGCRHRTGDYGADGYARAPVSPLRRRRTTAAAPSSRWVRGVTAPSKLAELRSLLAVPFLPPPVAALVALSSLATLVRSPPAAAPASRTRHARRAVYRARLRAVCRTRNRAATPAPTRCKHAGGRGRELLHPPLDGPVADGHAHVSSRRRRRRRVPDGRGDGVVASGRQRLRKTDLLHPRPRLPERPHSIAIFFLMSFEKAKLNFG